MKKRQWIAGGALLGLMILLAGCSGGSKKYPVLTLEGSYNLTLGVSSLKEVQEAGYSDRYSYSDKDAITAMSWENFYAMKDETSYGDMKAGNKSSKEIPLEEGVVFEIYLDYIDPDYELGDVTVNGVDFTGYTRDQIKEAMGDATPYLDSDEYLSYKTKSSSYTFRFKEGSETLTSLRVNDGTEKEYVIQ